MQSSLIGKIEKAKRYAEEPERVTFIDFDTDFRGENSNYRVSYKDGKWQCTCLFFAQRGICSHTMALQRLLGTMLPKDAVASPVIE
jgi:SWIM zinc finger